MSTPTPARALAALAAACTDTGALTPLAREGLAAVLARLTPAERLALLADTVESPTLVYHGRGQAQATAAALEHVAGPLEAGSRIVFGDNLAVMGALAQEKAAGALVCADGTPGARLVYMDPPFATGRDFRFADGQRAYTDKVTGPEFLEFLRARIGAARDLMADDGTMYIHLDPHAAHAAKALADEVFGERSFRGEVIWKRSSAKGSASRAYGAMHDTLLVYSRSRSSWVWNRQFTAYSAEHRAKFYRLDDGDGRGLYGLDNLQKPEAGRGYQYEYDGYEPPAKGWYVTLATMERLDAEGRLHKPADKTRRLRLKRYLSEAKGVPLQDIWDDISPVQRPVYPTQKPDALLQRIVAVSSNPGDLVLDPFCGAGTTLAAAEASGRVAVTIDLGVDAVRAARARVPDAGLWADAQMLGVLRAELAVHVAP